MSSNTHDELTPSFEYRDPSREHHLEILMPTVDLDPAIPRNNLLPFTHLFIHIAEMYYSSFVRGLFAHPFLEHEAK